MTTQTVIESALHYADLGLSVVPIIPGQKLPPSPWKNSQSKLPLADELRRKFGAGNFGVGFATGAVSGVVVIDIDPVRMSTENLHLVKSRFSAGGDLATVPRVRTGGGGYHLYFSHPGHPVPNAVDVVPGMDIRGDGGLVVAPPSVHKSGRQYVWEVPFSREAMPSFDRTPLPAPKRGGVGTWIERALKGVEEGSRNDTAARLAGYLLGKKIPAPIVVEIMMTTFASKCRPPLSKVEVVQVVNSVAKRENSVAAPPALFPVTHVRDFMAEYSEENVRWTVNEWLPDAAIVFLVAPPGTFKTWLLLDLAISVASGRPFLGKYDIVRRGPVIVVQQEDHKPSLAQRMAQIWSSRLPWSEDEVPQSDLPIWLHESRALRLDSADSIKALAEQVSSIRPALVLIDPLYSAVSTSDYMASAPEQMMGLKTMRDKYGCSFVIAHHTRKKQDDGRLGAWGSQFLNAFMETGWQLRRADQSPDSKIISVIRHHKSAAPPPTVTLEWAIGDNSYAVNVGQVSEVGNPTEAILLALVGRPMTIHDLTKEVGVHRSTVSRRLQSLLGDGLVMKDGSHWLLTGE